MTDVGGVVGLNRIDRLARWHCSVVGRRR